MKKLERSLRKSKNNLLTTLIEHYKDSDDEDKETSNSDESNLVQRNIKVYEKMEATDSKVENTETEIEQDTATSAPNVYSAGTVQDYKHSDAVRTDESVEYVEPGKTDDLNVKDEISVLDGQMSVAPQYNTMTYAKSESIEESIETEEAHVDTKDDYIYNANFLSMEDKTYCVENFEKNALLIFNHFELDGYPTPRYGTEKDVEALQNTFGKLSFDVDVHHELKRNEIHSTLDEFSKQDFTDYGCVVIVVLTHGSEGGYLRAKDRSYHESEIINYFICKNNPTLITKAKVFIFQACRGTQTSAALFAGKLARIQRDAAKEPRSYTLPGEADVLLLHSTYAGNAALRDPLEGSWFIQTLCNHIDNLAATSDLETIMMEVKKDVAINKTNEYRNKSTNEMETDKQMPVVTSTLIRKLYLKPQSFTELDIDSANFQSLSRRLSIKSKCDTCQGFARKYFVHMRNALKGFHSSDHPTASTGQLLLRIADSIDENLIPDNTMRTTAQEIGEYLRTNATDWIHFSYILFSDVS